MLLKDIIHRGIETVSVLYPEGEAREMVFAYMEDVFGLKRHMYILDPAYRLSDLDSDKALSDFVRMSSGEPLQYVTGKAYFYGREFRVTPDVLIPRGETEIMVNVLSQEGIPISVLDLCTGSGCIAWSLALENPGVEVTAVDISEGALSVASSQDFAQEMRSSGAQKPTFLKADVLKGPQACVGLVRPASGKFDIIVSNPPYVMESEKSAMRSNVLDHEPHLALFVPDDDPLKFYRAVALWAKELLAEEGTGMVEINEALGQETREVFTEMGFGYTEIVRDLHGKDRFVSFSKVPLRKKNRFF
ncbi:MAG: peptide chain release factor N(5)-glutamine methyltransferase [Bacteroidales bacterium]|nr:peptide chain release factor N(5)-glutamine methyltransferase [Bacteroidales bacterium]